MTKIAFIGLGAMGFPIAGHLAEKSGCALAVYNRSPEKARHWIRTYSGEIAETAREAAAGCDFVFAAVGNDADVVSATTGETGAFASMKPGGVFVDHSSTSAVCARAAAARATEKGLFFLDAPVSGGQSGAEKGVLSIMCGGDAQAFARAEPLMRLYASSCLLAGPSGAGQLTKMANQICLAGIIQSLAEGLHFAQSAGLDPHAVLEAISKGAAQSWQMDHRAKTMLAQSFDFGFAVNWMRKDLGNCLDEARRCGAPLPVTALIDQFYADIQNMGGERWDTSSLIARFSRPPA